MKKLICLLLTILLLLPFTAGCTTGLQGNVSIIISYLDGSTITISGHRTFGEENDSESIYYKLSERLVPSQEPEVGKSTYFTYADGGVFSEEQVYQLDNGATIKLKENQKLKSYKVAYYSECPEVGNTKYYEKNYTFGDKIEYEQEIENLLIFDDANENFDRYNLVGWEIFYTNEQGEETTYEYIFNENFDAKYDEYFNNAKVSHPEYYYYYMKVRAIWKPNTFNVVLNFEHEGVKQLTTSVEPVTYTSDFNVTDYDKNYFLKHVKEENIEFVGFSTDKFTYVPLPTEIDKSQDGTTIQLYAIWSRYKTIKVNFLDGSGPISVKVYEDKYEQYYNLHPYYLDKYLTSEQIKGFIGLSSNREGTSRIIKTYELCNENTIYYPVIAR